MCNPLHPDPLDLTNVQHSSPIGTCGPERIFSRPALSSTLGTPPLTKTYPFISLNNIYVSPLNHSLPFSLNSGKAAFPCLSISPAAFSTSATICFALSDSGGRLLRKAGAACQTCSKTKKPVKKALSYHLFLSLKTAPSYIILPRSIHPPNVLGSEASPRAGDVPWNLLLEIISLR